MEFVREFGLILFVYTLGLQIGPGFFAARRSRGIALNLFAASIVFWASWLRPAGSFPGALMCPRASACFRGPRTNTPSLAAAQQALQEAGAAEDAAVVQGLGYAIAYPFGIGWIILTMIIVRTVFRIDVKKEVTEAEALQRPSVPPLATRNFEVRNPNLVGCVLGEVPGLNGSGAVGSRFSREGVVAVAKADTPAPAGRHPAFGRASGRSEHIAHRHRERGGRGS